MEGGEVLIGMLVEGSCGERSNWSGQRAEFQEWDPGALRGGGVDGKAWFRAKVKGKTVIYKECLFKKKKKGMVLGRLSKMNF